MWRVIAPDGYGDTYKLKNSLDGRVISIPTRGPEDWHKLGVGAWTWANRVAKGLAAQMNRNMHEPA